jgi:hypothetical protein
MKVLITSPCQVNFNDDKGARHVDDGEVIEVDKDTARTLVSVANRGKYVNKADDPSKGLNTATSEEIGSARERLADKRKAEAKKAAAADKQ